jgi:hypothetical protein
VTARERLRDVLAILGVGPHEDARAAAGRLAAQDWRRVDALLARHRVPAAFLHRVHDRGLAGRLPPPLLAACSRRGQVILANNLRLLRERERVLATLATAEVPVLVLKGACLLDRAYPTPGWRPMSDLDLLVRPADASRAVAALADVRYHPADSAAARVLGEGGIAEVVLTTGAGSGAIDLHVSVKGPGAAAAGALTEALWADCRPFGDSPGAAEPSAPAHLLYLVAHGFLQHTPSRLRQLLDLHHPLAWWLGESDWSWPTTIALAARLGLTRPLDASLVLLDRLLGTTVAAQRGLAPPQQGSLWQHAAGPLAEILLADRSTDFESLLPLDEFWGARSWRAWARLVSRGTLVGAPEVPGGRRPPLGARLAFRCQVLRALLRDPRAARRFAQARARLAG